MNLSNFLQENVVLSLDDVGLDGQLHVPANASSIIMIVCGKDSSEFSDVNRKLVDYLNQQEFATLTLDLCTSEEQDLERLDVKTQFLTRRVLEASKWLKEYGETEHLHLGYFAVGMGVPAAIRAASVIPRQVRAIVGRQGHPDVAGPALRRLKAPTLLITNDCEPEITSHRNASSQMERCEHHLEIVPTSSSFDEDSNNNLENVVLLASKWFSWYMERDRDRS